MSVFVSIKTIISTAIQEIEVQRRPHPPKTGRGLDNTKRKMTMNIARSLTNWRKYRQTVTELGRMSDRELTDLGIGRSDIRRVARNAVGI